MIPRDGGEPVAEEVVCRQVVELVTEYLEDALSPEERSRFEAHLQGCRHCRAYVEQIRQTVRALAATGGGSVDSRTRAELLRLFRAWTTDPAS